MTIRVMLVDDHKILRDALHSVLEREPDVSVVAGASDGNEALSLMEACKPDVVVMDIGMPGIGGVETTRRLLRDFPTARVLALSTYSDRRIVLQMLEANASGYVVKSAGRDELLRAIRAVSQGRTYLCPEVSAIVVDSMRGKRPVEKPRADRLGRRELEVLRLLAEGQTSPEIATTLYIATSTVEVHRRNIMRKLDLHSVAELTKYAIRNGLTTA
ncbi:response regulator transcription factor [Niveibacterium sp. 24ML]|uniref:response regulator n=1 Tax=Niveibacterium sp. 24ML TaxID=2985512 RepID=UPI00226E51D6|nr:response regulator transcription factor [Niveibacterium sp. 24ML]MCX9158500.1 response regulator transcription factor [Niveibacterium sp. 24ML]